jgi:hypothetical protein
VKHARIDLWGRAAIVAGSTRGRGRNLAVEGSTVITDAG